jgi:hypothetical protein
MAGLPIGAAAARRLRIAAIVRRTRQREPIQPPTAQRHRIAAAPTAAWMRVSESR